MPHPGRGGRSERRPSHSFRLTAVLVSIAVTAGLLVIAGMGVFVFWPLFFPPEGSGPEEHPAVGQKFPALELAPLTGDGSPVTLADLSGHVVLLDFWATWCPPCRQELPHLAAMESQFRDKADFRLLPVCHHDKETIVELREAARALLEELGIDLPTYVDPHRITRTALDATVGFDALPTTVILDRTGVIRGVWRGYSPGVEEEMEALVVRLLGQG